MKLSKAVSFLYKLARKANDVKVIVSGNPVRIGRRIKNKYIGKKLIRRIW